MKTNEDTILELTAILILISTTEGLTLNGAKDMANRALKEVVSEECIKDAVELITSKSSSDSDSHPTFEVFKK